MSTPFSRPKRSARSPRGILLPAGKLPAPFLADLLHSLPVTGPRLLLGPAVGEDASVIDFAPGGETLSNLILLAGSTPLETASIIARERRPELLRRGWSAVALDKAAGYLFAPGISVVRPALAVAELVTAMHDPTEGGVATGLAELAQASRVGLEVDLDAIPTPDLARRLCAEYGIDPLGAISSGALLAAARPDQAEAVLNAWAACGWPGAVIGRCLPVGEGRIACRAGHVVAFPSFAVDELAKLAAAQNS